jgi:hypothetical protein
VNIGGVITPVFNVLQLSLQGLVCCICTGHQEYGSEMKVLASFLESVSHSCPEIDFYLYAKYREILLLNKKTERERERESERGCHQWQKLVHYEFSCLGFHLQGFFFSSSYVSWIDCEFPRVAPG